MNPIATQTAASQPTGLRTWAGFIAMCLGMFMAILDIQIVASSLPAIQAALDIATDRLGWVQTAYLIAEVVAIPLTARLTRVMTLRGLFVAAIAGFALASLGCALSATPGQLIAFRVIQGFCGGMVIPAVFTTVFVLFPADRRIVPTAVAGMFAMLAPTLGPAVGGFITETWSWHWLFLVNLVPSAVVVAAVAACVRLGAPHWRAIRDMDWTGLALASLSLACLQLLLAEGPKRDWQGGFVIALIVICLAGGTAAIRRCLVARRPYVALGAFRGKGFAVSCALSFVLGAGLYGSVYLLPLFLGYVRHHTPLEIGGIMIVCGAAQLATAPVASVAEKYVDPRALAAFGYALFAAGLISNGFATYETDFDGLFWPQVLRGAAVMFCLLPTTAMALDGRTGDGLADASALFNLLRNLGGAIAIALIDTILSQRTPGHAAALAERLRQGDADAAALVGLPAELVQNAAPGPIDEATRAYIAPLVERAALVQSFNEAWLLLGAAFCASILALALLSRSDARPGGR